MDTMIERVARAICENQKGARDWDRIPKERKRDHIETARAAIEAMREPTEAVGREAFNHVVTDDWLDFLRGYRAIIDAALEE
jgi:hypothetical protein